MLPPLEQEIRWGGRTRSVQCAHHKYKIFNTLHFGEEMRQTKRTFDIVPFEQEPRWRTQH